VQWSELLDARNEMEALEQLRQRLVRLAGHQGEIEEISRLALALETARFEDLASLWSSMVREHSEAALPYVYVANDIVQKAKSAQPALFEAFKKHLPRALAQLQDDSTNRAKYVRILNIWSDRRVFEQKFIHELKKKLSPLTEFGELPNVDFDASGVGESPQAAILDEDEDEEFFDEADKEKVGPQARMQREDSMGSIQNVALPRLLIVAKRAEKEAETLLQNAIEKEESEVGTELKKISERGTGKTIEESLREGLKKMDDGEFDVLAEATLTKLAQGVLQRKRLRRAGVLEGVLISALEKRLEQVATSEEKRAASQNEIDEVQKMVEKLQDENQGASQVTKIVSIKKKVLKKQPEKRGKRDRESDSESGSSEDDDDDESEGENESDDENEKGTDIKDDVFGFGKKRKKKKRKKKKVTDVEEDKPMMWSKQLHMYVPLPDSRDEEQWRN